MKINSTVETLSKSVKSYPYIGEDRRNGILILFTSPDNGIVLSKDETSMFDVGQQIGANEYYFEPTSKCVILSNDLLT